MRYINPEYIKIPNILLNDKEVTNDARVLYAYIWYITYIDDCEATNKEFCELLGITQPTLNKCLKILETKKYILIERKNKNIRVITPLINQSMILRATSRKDEYMNKLINQKREEQQQKINDAIQKEIPQEFIEFVNNIK